MIVSVSEGTYVDTPADLNSKTNSIEELRFLLNENSYELLTVLFKASPCYMTEKELHEVPKFKHFPGLLEKVLRGGFNCGLVEEIYGDKDAPNGHEIGYAITSIGESLLKVREDIIHCYKDNMEAIFF